MSSPQIITVLKGGPSAERDVSLRSGAAVARACAKDGMRVAVRRKDGLVSAPGTA